MSLVHRRTVHAVVWPRPEPATRPQAPLPRILIVDDNSELARRDADFLQDAHFSTDVLEGVADVPRRVITNPPTPSFCPQTYRQDRPSTCVSAFETTSRGPSSL